MAGQICVAAHGIRRHQGFILSVGAFRDGLNLLPSITKGGGDDLLPGIQHPGVMFWRSHLLSLGKVMPDFVLITCLDVFISLRCETDSAKEPWEIAEHR